MDELKFYKCIKCGNIIEMIKCTGVPIMCCGEEMIEIPAQIHETGAEKHVPDVKMGSTMVEVQIGEVLHPSTKEHHIEWIALQTENGVMRRMLMPGEEPKATFFIDSEDEPVAVYGYCNIHGLWKKELMEKTIATIIDIEDDEISSDC